MTNTRARSKLSKPIPRRRRISWTRVQVKLPVNVCRICDHPLLGFRHDHIHSLVHDSSDLPLEAIPIIDLGPIEMIQIRIDLPQHVLDKFNEVCALRSCSQEVLINSSLAEWLDGFWYKGGQPKPLLEICETIGIDLIMTSNYPETLQNYYAGVFGSPSELGGTGFWADPTFAWAERLRKRYKSY